MKPTLEEVKEYFRDAETVKESGTYNREVNLSDYNLDEIETSEFGNICLKDSSSFYLCGDKYGYAKILTHKNNKMKLTKELAKKCMKIKTNLLNNSL